MIIHYKPINLFHMDGTHNFLCFIAVKIMFFRALSMYNCNCQSLSLVNDRTFGSGSVVRPNLVVWPGSAEPPNHEFLPNQNRTNHKLRFYLIFEFTRGYLSSTTNYIIASEKHEFLLEN